MSQENVDVVRRAWEAFVRHDNETALALYAPEIEIDVRHEARIGGGVYHGLEGVQRYFRDYLSVFGDVRFLGDYPQSVRDIEFLLQSLCT